MIAPALVAFAHFSAFFALTAALVLQLALISESISVATARSIQRWNADLNQDIAPELSMQAVQKIRKIMHTELVGILGILLCASLMAKGFGG